MVNFLLAAVLWGATGTYLIKGRHVSTSTAALFFFIGFLFVLVRTPFKYALMRLSPVCPDPPRLIPPDFSLAHRQHRHFLLTELGCLLLLGGALALIASPLGDGSAIWILGLVVFGLRLPEEAFRLLTISSAPDRIRLFHHHCGSLLVRFWLVGALFLLLVFLPSYLPRLLR
jgi:hypothetical protein